jgi:N-ethylmaleimide reductase
VVAAVTGVWGKDRVGIKLSPSNTFNDMKDSQPIETFSYVIKALNQFDLAYVHLMETTPADLRHGGTTIPTKIFRPLYQGRLMANAGYTKATADQALAAGDADLVSFGSLFIANPDLPERFHKDAPLNTPDPQTFYAYPCDDSTQDCNFAKGYIDYPFLAD